MTQFPEPFYMFRNYDTVSRILLHVPKLWDNFLNLAIFSEIMTQFPESCYIFGNCDTISFNFLIATPKANAQNARYNDVPVYAKYKYALICLSLTEFSVRLKQEVAHLSFVIYLSKKIN